jgi:hypothetical protein
VAEDVVADAPARHRVVRAGLVARGAAVPAYAAADGGDAVRYDEAHVQGVGWIAGRNTLTSTGFEGGRAMSSAAGLPLTAAGPSRVLARRHSAC